MNGTTRLTGPNPVSHPPHEPPFDLQRKGSGGGGRTRGRRRGRVHIELSGSDAGGTANREGHPRPFLRKSPETAGVREGPMTTGAQTTELGHHNGEFVKDVRVSPVDEGVGFVKEDELSRAARRPRTGASGSLPRSRRTARSRRLDGQNCRHRAPRVGARRTSFWGHLGSISCQKCVKKCPPREPGEIGSASVPKLRARR